MDSSAEPMAGVVMPADATPAPTAGRRALELASRVFLFPVKLFWGMAFCQGLSGSILVLGWTYRLAQRSVLKYWWSRSEQGGRGFSEFLAEDPQTRLHRYWPNWFFRQNLRELRARPRGLSWLRYVGALLLAPVRSLWTNYWIGLRGILTTWTLTLPAGLLWWFGWYDGWNNSFNKGYEQAPVGPLISITGIFLFIAVMFYVPLAQARQAVTGEWRSFYQFRLIWSVVRLRWLACAGLALLYSLLALPLNIMKTFPMFFLQARPELADLGDPLLLKRLNGYFFWCALLVFPAFVLLRLVAARIYASGILSLVQSGRIPAGSLSAFENETLQRLGLPGTRPQPERSRIMRLIAWTGSRLGRTVSGFALVFIWFSFVAQIYINEFLHYHGAIAWINQPLIQLPLFHYLPSRLKNPGGEILFAIFLLLLFWLIASVTRVFLPRKTARPT
jgi:hypothetical protein